MTSWYSIQPTTRCPGSHAVPDPKSQHVQMNQHALAAAICFKRPITFAVQNALDVHPKLASCWTIIHTPIKGLLFTSLCTWSKFVVIRYSIFLWTRECKIIFCYGPVPLTGVEPSEWWRQLVVGLDVSILLDTLHTSVLQDSYSILNSGSKGRQVHHVVMWHHHAICISDQ